MIPKPTTCAGCPLHDPPLGKQMGFSRVDGTGLNGVMLIAEALGESEEEEGIALVGKAGHYLFSQLARVDVLRDDFTLFNTLACRPPNNKLAKMPFEAQAIKHCAPNLDKAIFDARGKAVAAGLTFTIVTLGRIAFKRVMGYDDKHPVMRKDYLNYPFWNETYGAWVIAAQHPSYLMRGNHSEVPVLQYGVKRAVEIARDGISIDKPTYILDPEPMIFKGWANDYKRIYEMDPENTYLSYDIETPMKQGKDEEEVAKEDDDDYTILRVSFAYRPGEAISIPWTATYTPILEELFSHPGAKVGWNNEQYDNPRVRAQMPMGGDSIDGMLAWHVLNTSLKKGLGFVTPFYAPTMSMWKHLSEEKPAFYNAVDADAALRCFLGIKRDLIANKQWDMFYEHVIKLNRVFAHMSKVGVLRDETMRSEAETMLSAKLDELEVKMEGAVPQEARKHRVYKKTPKDTAGMIQIPGEIKLPQCPVCGEIPAPASHFKSIGKKRLKAGDLENYCVDRKAEKVMVPTLLWAKPLEFKISNKGMQTYQKVLKHQAVLSRKERKITFDEKAILRLQKKYPKDPLYPLILEHREHQGLLTKYIGVTQLDGTIKGGLDIEKDGAIHTCYTHNPSTLRSAAQNPPLQQLPRTSNDKTAPGNIIRNLIMAREGHTFLARDYSGIEAVLVGWFARLPDYIRLAKMDVHSFYTAYALNQLDGRVKANDLPLLSWDDDKLSKRLKEIKGEFSTDRNNLYKHLVHGCVTGDHEVLTTEGWKRFDVLEDDDKVAQWENGVITFVTPERVVRQPWNGDLHTWRAHSLSISMTRDHKVPIVNSYGTLQSHIADNISPAIMNWGRVPVHGILDQKDVIVTDACLRLAVAIQADGTISGNHVIFHLVKDRKKQRLLELLKSRGIPYSETPCKCHPRRGVRIAFNVKGVPVWNYVWNGNKTFCLDALMKLSTRQRQVFLDELPWWDGTRSEGKAGRQTSYISTNKHNAEVVQLITHITGRQGILTAEINRPGNRKDLYTVSFNQRDYCSLSSIETRQDPYEGLVYCVTVPSGWFMIRHNGKVSITGNSNFMQGPGGAAEKILLETSISYPVDLVAKVMDIYFELFPGIRKWHKETLLQADKDGFLKNPFSYIHRFNKVYDWEKVGGEWQRRNGPESNKVIAFLPQSTAAGIIKEAMIRLYFDHFDAVGQYLRLLIHDELLFEIPLDKIKGIDDIIRIEMENPIRVLPLPASYNMNQHLVINTERKIGTRWGLME